MCNVKNIKCYMHCHPKSIYNDREEIMGKGAPPTLSKKDRRDLHKTTWLHDQLMTAANQLLKAEFPNTCGLQETILQQNFSFDIPTEEFVQFLHVNSSHWITIQTLEATESQSAFTTQCGKADAQHD